MLPATTTVYRTESADSKYSKASSVAPSATPTSSTTRDRKLKRLSRSMNKKYKHKKAYIFAFMTSLFFGVSTYIQS